MREIKFRAWDIVRSKMLSNIDLWNIPYNEIFIHTPDKRALNIMQYTGLKDKNGVEIYEGDIVRCHNNVEDLHEVKFGEFKVYDERDGEVIDRVTGWYMQILENDKLSNTRPFCNPSSLNSFWIKYLFIEVVGNVYENLKMLDKMEKEL